MPKPNTGESKQDYISRCIAHLIENEGKTQDQAAGQCYGMWRQHTGEKRVKVKVKKKK